MAQDSRHPFALRLQRLRVPIGFAFGLLFLVFSKPSSNGLASGLLLAFLGLLLRAWAAGHLQKHEKLAVSGPYQWTRNPLYLGSFVLGMGFSVAAGRWWLPPLFLVLFLLVYLPVMRVEEAELRRCYGAAARDYLEQVSQFLPLHRPVPCESGEMFSWERYLRNREYRAVVGFVLLATFLVARHNLI